MLGYIKSKTTLYMRDSCYQCRFKGIGRMTDITLADFWGVEKQYPDIDSYKATSKNPCILRQVEVHEENLPT